MAEEKSARIHVTKIGAAKGQLETAIRLWLGEADPISIHTLATSALKVLNDGGKMQGIESWLIARPNPPPEWREYSMAYQNFFKHARQDAYELLPFDPGATEFISSMPFIVLKELCGIPLPAIRQSWRDVFSTNVNVTKFIGAGTLALKASTFVLLVVQTSSRKFGHSLE